MMWSEFVTNAWSAFEARAISYAPTILATTGLLIVGLLFSWLVGSLTKRASRRFGLDRQLEETGLRESLTRVGLSKPTSAIIGKLVFWLVFLCFMVLALENLGLDLAELPVRTFLIYVPRLIGAVILLIVGLLLAALLGRATDGGLRNMGVASHERIASIVRWVLTALAVVATIDHLGFDVALVTGTFSNLITIIAAGLALAFAWGGREVARNILASYYVKENFRSGDVVVVDGHEGRLEEIGSLNSRLATARGSVVVPNSRLVEQTVETRAARGSSTEPDPGPKS